ncbi:MAG: hypothetical protein Q4F72_04155 [Desulfovibrionaceae bacterium]|nr:hypothetical protein [Desulfovibrionaceae bacterium]
MLSRHAPRICVILLLALFLLLAPSHGQAKGLTCDFYDIPEIPEGWSVSIPPGFNERKSSLGHFINKTKDCSVMIQVSETKTRATLAEATEQTLNSLRSNGCKILNGPSRQGELTRLEVTLTGTPAVMWVGTDSDVLAVTVISGDREECRLFLAAFRNASPRLFPSAEQVQP